MFPVYCPPSWISHFRFTSDSIGNSTVEKIDFENIGVAAVAVGVNFRGDGVDPDPPLFGEGDGPPHFLVP